LKWSAFSSRLLPNACSTTGFSQVTRRLCFGAQRWWRH